ncbi:MAG: group II intron reverse transcriptase/maturase [Actinomycetota bacterium]|nr:group II intron reverse transcriptase/maturase [Actinomycetota bacterium]
MNTGAPFPSVDEAQERVLRFQRKLHEWASNDAERRFHDLWNLVCDPATLVVAWLRVSRNRGSRTAGVDAATRRHVEALGVERFLTELRGELRARTFRPLPVRERMIPKRDGRMRRLGIPTLKDRVAQMALKLVMEPIFESGFYASSYAYRPGRRTQDAIAETHHFTTRSYEWIVETDVEACFDRLPHCLIIDEVRRRIVDKRVLALVRLFLKAGLMTETGRLQRTVTGTPQGGIASPLLANIALSALDRQYQADWQEMSRYNGRRQHLQRTGHPTYRLVRYADDLLLLVRGTRKQAEALLEQLAGRVQALGLQLKAEKTAVTHIDEGFVFLGQRIVRRPKGNKRHVYTFVSNESLASVRRKVKALTGRSTLNMELSELIAALNPVLRGWGNHFRHAAAKRTLDYLGYYAWWRVGRWLRKKHPRLTWKQIQRRYAGEGIFQEKGIVLFNPGSISVTRYRYRGARIPNPWTIEPTADPSGLRRQRASREEQRSLARVQQALA